VSRIHYKNYRGITQIGRNLRKNCTPEEILLWNFLRRRSILGFKFLRQHPIYYRIDKEWVEFYIADFYCAELQLIIIELDGPIHDHQK
jgi:leucyl-tRNA synthetase